MWALNPEYLLAADCRTYDTTRIYGISGARSQRSRILQQSNRLSRPEEPREEERSHTRLCRPFKEDNASHNIWMKTQNHYRINLNVSLAKQECRLYLEVQILQT